MSENGDAVMRVLGQWIGIDSASLDLGDWRPYDRLDLHRQSRGRRSRICVWGELRWRKRAGLGGAGSLLWLRFGVEHGGDLRLMVCEDADWTRVARAMLSPWDCLGHRMFLECGSMDRRRRMFCGRSHVLRVGPLENWIENLAVRLDMVAAKLPAPMSRTCELQAYSMALNHYPLADRAERTLETVDLVSVKRGAKSKAKSAAKNMATVAEGGRQYLYVYDVVPREFLVVIDWVFLSGIRAERRVVRVLAKRYVYSNSGGAALRARY